MTQEEKMTTHTANRKEAAKTCGIGYGYLISYAHQDEMESITESNQPPKVTPFALANLRALAAVPGEHLKRSCT
jgi:hypothetical protein